MTRKTVVIVQEVLPQYRLEFYQQLRDRLASTTIDLKLIHGVARGDRASRADEAQLEWAQVARGYSIGLPRAAPAIWQPILGQTGSADLVIVEHANRQLANYVLLARHHFGHKPRLAFWGHGANLQSNKSYGPRPWLKSYTAKLPDWWFAYTKGSALRVIEAGFPPDRITVVQNSADTSAYHGLNIQRRPYQCVFLGGLYAEKRLDYLIEAGNIVATKLPEFNVIVIGNGPMRDFVEHAALKFTWLRFHHQLFGIEKALAVRESSLLLLPGLVGLAVLDSFAAQTPIVTVDVPYHSPEYEYLTNQYNSIILPAGATTADYANELLQLLTSPLRLKELRIQCKDSASQYSLKSMVENFAEGIELAISSPNRPHYPH
jgi:glycosyltransferase involved in cell wall biosynthesis